MAVINGIPGDDVIVGTNDDDTIIASAGTDQIDGSLGTDIYDASAVSADMTVDLATNPGSPAFPPAPDRQVAARPTRTPRIGTIGRVPSCDWA